MKLEYEIQLQKKNKIKSHYCIKKGICIHKSNYFILKSSFVFLTVYLSKHKFLCCSLMNYFSLCSYLYYIK